MPIRLIALAIRVTCGYVAGMSKQQIRRLIEDRVAEDGLVETGVTGVQLFRVTEPVRCAPAVYEPSSVGIGGTASRNAAPIVTHGVPLHPTATSK